ncbi:uncharacterized protein TRAVEDRAFT_65071 [Trametes versicolor FP-101664 SS1]|uniref:uncharacterized protein n=1 Tax=Trametes versicolor (strain FP-101664) TaxID=717944 RepID=UPI0004621D73|nr:uncharacterized protein TRAVEDRAFT_65071 [Trametes versicolor FP-101664 SS1]EIW58827.1 hypothetical protein TRAVEDRAFT_65071 [Trametes versicolor FP-101664 SS1]
MQFSTLFVTIAVLAVTAIASPVANPSKIKSRRDTAPDSDNHKHAQMMRLREELETCAMKIAQLQARLIATLDELDTQRDAHLREINAERNAKEKLSRKLDGYLDEVTRAERERDDMRELVSILVEKVESCNNLSVWPCGRINLPHPVSSLAAARTQNPAAEDYDAVHAAVVDLLRKRLVEEQGAHARTKQQTDAEILRLRAMIARRDAELEACATHDAHHVLLSSSAPNDTLPSRVCTRPNCVNGRAAHASGSGLSCHHHAAVLGGETAEADNILARATSRNRVLEREVEILRQSVHQVQHSQSSDAKRRHAQGRHQHAPEKPLVSVQVQTADPVLGSEAQYTLPPSPGLLPHTMSRSPSPYALGSRHPLTPAPAPLPSQATPFVQERGVPTPGASIKHLMRDIDVLALNIDDFVVERAAVKAMLARELPKTLSTPSHTPSESVPALNPVSHVADECARRLITDVTVKPVRERQELREQVDAISRERARREHELQTEIASLRKALDDLRHDQTARPPPPQQHSSQPQAESVLLEGLLKAPSALSPRVSPTLVPDDARALQLDKAQADGQRAHESHWDDEDRQRINEPELSREAPEFGEQSIEFGEQSIEFGEQSIEFGEQSMEIATPLQTNTILSLREDDWPIPPSDFPVRASADADVDPAGIPLPTSPDIEGDPAPPPRAPSPLLAFASSPPPPSSPSPPPLYIAAPHVPLDLLARIESAAQERVASIEREIAATHRELEDREAALASVRARLPPE